MFDEDAIIKDAKSAAYSVRYEDDLRCAPAQRQVVMAILNQRKSSDALPVLKLWSDIYTKETLRLSENDLANEGV